MARTSGGPLLALTLTLLVASPASAGTGGYLDKIRDDPSALGRFMRALPKGGDIHSHLSGAVYAESMAGWAAEDGLCLDRTTLAASPPSGLSTVVPVLPPCSAGQRPASDLPSDPELFKKAVNAWSMRGFVPGEESGHDHFFATFDKFGPTQRGHEGEVLAEVATRAARQHVHYLELLHTFAFGAVWQLGNQVGLSSDLGTSRDALLAGGMSNVVAAARAELDGIESQFDSTLACRAPGRAEACDLPIRFDYQVLRAQPPQVVFAQLVLAFELMQSDPRIVGVNLVQPEDDPVARRDYRLHMRMIESLRGVYTGEHVTLHAGELTSRLVPKEDLDFHIGAAVRKAGAERIGHGVAIRREHGAKRLMRRMARDDVPVEICLTSNEQILGVSGRHHPFPLYRRSGVPTVLATDDEGVLRTDLTEQYELAAREYDLSYGQLKRISRDSLEYGFLERAQQRRAARKLDDDFRRFERRFG